MESIIFSVDGRKDLLKKVIKNTIDLEGQILSVERQIAKAIIAINNERSVDQLKQYH